MYCLTFYGDWANYFDNLPHELKDRITKKINSVLENPYKRHMAKGARFFVAEVGQYRLIYRIFEETKEIRFYFVGNHKRYEKWYKQFF